jgi:glycosyltransferase involved in cell wall biosynthesis
LNIVKRIKQKIFKSVQKTPINYVLNNDWIEHFKVILSNCDSEYIALCHKDWKGVTSSSMELFNKIAFIQEVQDSLTLEAIVDIIIKSKVTQFILSGYPQGWSNVIKAVHIRCPEKIFKVLWHGSIAQHYEDYATKVFLEILKLNKDGNIKMIGFVKKSTFELYKKLGYRVAFVGNSVDIKNIVETSLKAIDFNKIKVGIFSADVTLRKNTYTNIAAVSFIENAELTICPSNQHLEMVIEHFNIKYNLYKSPLPRHELFDLIKKQDIVFYVTFSECAPMLPLEAMELGVICLMGSNCHYYEDYPLLKEYLVVTEADNPEMIAKMALRALQNKEKIMVEYRKFSLENRTFSRKSVETFLLN